MGVTIIPHSIWSAPKPSGVFILAVWQHPHVNLFKHYGVGQWKKCSKAGDVTSAMVGQCSAFVPFCYP